MTVKEAIKEIVKRNDNDLTIHTSSLKKQIYELLYPRCPMDSTITRKLRNLRYEGYEIECVSKRQSKYKITKKEI